jgi:hypothetical protein
MRSPTHLRLALALGGFGLSGSGGPRDAAGLSGRYAFDTTIEPLGGDQYLSHIRIQDLGHELDLLSARVLVRSGAEARFELTDRANLGLKIPVTLRIERETRIAECRIEVVRGFTVAVHQARVRLDG